MKNKIIILLLIIIGLGYLFLYNDSADKKRLFKELQGKTDKIEFLTKNVANLERQYTTQQELVIETKRQFSEYRIRQDKRIKVLSNATFIIREKARKQGRSDIEYKGNRLKYVVNEIRYKDGPAVGYVLIFDDGRVVSKIYNHEINVKTLVARDEEKGFYDVVSKADYILKSPSLQNGWLNKPYPLKIKGGTALIDPTEPVNLKKRFYFKAIQANANINTYVNEIKAGVGVSLMGYGYSKQNLDFKFLQFGVDYNKDNLGLTFTPVLYRPFKNVLNNTYIGIGINNNNSVLLGIQVGL